MKSELEGGNVYTASFCIHPGFIWCASSYGSGSAWYASRNADECFVTSEPIGNGGDLDGLAGVNVLQSVCHYKHNTEFFYKNNFRSLVLCV